MFENKKPTGFWVGHFRYENKKISYITSLFIYFFNGFNKVPEKKNGSVKFR